MSHLGCASMCFPAVMILGLCDGPRAQPLAINPSAAPSEVGNPSSINPAARASDIRNPSSINPAAAASAIPQPGTTPSRPSGGAAPNALPQAAPTAERALAVHRRADRSYEAGRIDDWQQLRQHLAKCWNVPPGTTGSSVTLRFMISSAGELRGPPMITATNATPKAMAPTYRDAAVSVLATCLPVRPTAEFGDAQAQAILIGVAVALVENLAVRQVRILVDGAVDRAAQADEKPVEALRHAKGGAGGGDERALGHGGVEVGAARPLRVELEAPFDIDLRIAADVEAQAELALAFRPVCALDVRVLAVAAAHRAGERMRRPVALQPD